MAKKTTPPASRRGSPKAGAPSRARTRPTRRTPRKAPPEVGPDLPSSLALEPHPSAARSGRAALAERIGSHHETGPALTGGDPDADWVSAYAVGDEAPGGDNPTPGQGVVDEYGRALGVEYSDEEELSGPAKITERDRHRWELDPASADDFEERRKGGR